MNGALKTKIQNKAKEAIENNDPLYAKELLKYLASQDMSDIENRMLLYKLWQQKENISKEDKLRSFFLKIQADQLAKKAKIQEAIRTYEQAFELNPFNANILLKIVEFLSPLTPKANELLKSIDINKIQDTEMLKRIAQIHLNAKELSLAKKILKRILIIQPQEIEAQRMIKNLEALGVLETDFSRK